MARLTGVTVTGVDEFTDLDRLNALSRRFPFVEWAILASAKSGGNHDRGNRYPTVRYLMPRGGRIEGNVAVHFCGQWAREAARHDGRDLFGMVKTLVPGVRRVQLNIGNDPGRLITENVVCAAQDAGITAIIQARFFQTPAATSPLRDRLHILHDCSGGRGIHTPFEAPPKSMQSRALSIGFAGGIGTQNIEAVCRQITKMPIPNPAWIDMEGQVRTFDKFDLDKVEQILTAAEPFITTLEGCAA